MKKHNYFMRILMSFHIFDVPENIYALIPKHCDFLFLKKYVNFIALGIREH